MRPETSEWGFFLVEALVATLIVILGVTVCFHGLSQNAKASEAIKAKSQGLEDLKYQQLNMELRGLGTGK